MTNCNLANLFCYRTKREVSKGPNPGLRKGPSNLQRGPDIKNYTGACILTKGSTNTHQRIVDEDQTSILRTRIHQQDEEQRRQLELEHQQEQLRQQQEEEQLRQQQERQQQERLRQQQERLRQHNEQQRLIQQQRRQKPQNSAKDDLQLQEYIKQRYISWRLLFLSSFFALVSFC